MIPKKQRREENETGCRGIQRLWKANVSLKKDAKWVIFFFFLKRFLVFKGGENPKPWNRPDKSAGLKMVGRPQAVLKPTIQLPSTDRFFIKKKY